MTLFSTNFHLVILMQTLCTYKVMQTCFFIKRFTCLCCLKIKHCFNKLFISALQRFKYEIHKYFSTTNTCRFKNVIFANGSESYSYGQEKYCKWKIVYNNFECLLYRTSLTFMTWCCFKEQMMLVKTPWK